MLNKGDILQNRYRILDRLGEGGMGAVYKAEDTKRFNKAVALKEVLLDLTNKNSEHIRRAFEREAKILTQIEHEAVPKVVDYFLETNCQFLVMELIEGDDLTDILQKRQTWFPLENVLNWTNQLLDALDYLHGLNPPIIHRDIKPQNLKLTSRGKIKLLDFGIAKDTGIEFSATLTDHTFIAATLHYSPFEQIIRIPFYYEPLHLIYGEKLAPFLLQGADARSDIYSLGATLYHLLTNVEPAGAYKRTLEVWSGKYDPLSPPHKIAPHLSPELSVFLLKAMAIERENRFSSVLEMKTALQEIVLDEKRRDYEEDQSILFEEQERLRHEREEIEAEREQFKAEQAESLRQIALERERQTYEKEEKERDRQLFERERQLREEKERDRQLFEAERQLREEKEREQRQLEEAEKKELERHQFEAEHEESLLEITFARERQRLQEKEIELECRRLEEEAQMREQQRLEDEAKKEREREELEASRRQLEAERRWLKIQHEESLRQIAAERERGRLEDEEKSRELERLQEERQRIETERQLFEAERQRLEAEAKEREQKLLEKEAKKEREREEIEAKLKAEEAEKQRQIALEQERLGLAEKERQRLEAEEKERQRLADEERKLLKLEEERQKLEAEKERKRLAEEAEKEREIQSLIETQQFNSAATLVELPVETLVDLPVEENLERAAIAQVSPFITQIDAKYFDSAEETEKKSSTELFAPLFAEEIESKDDDILEIEVEPEKPEVAFEFDEQDIEFTFEKQEDEVKSDEQKIVPEPIALAEVETSFVPVVATAIENSFVPGFATEPPRKAAWILPIAIIVLLILGGGAFGMWMMFGGSESGNANNSANSANSANSTTNSEIVAPSASPTVEPSVMPENSPTPAPTQITPDKEKTKPTVAPTINKTPTVKTPPPPIKTPKPTQDPNCVFTNSCK